ERDDLAPLHPVDHALADAASLGVERVRVARRLDELVLAARGDLDDVGVERAHALPLELVSRARCAVALPCRRRDRELGHTLLLEKVENFGCEEIRCGSGPGTPGGSGTDWRPGGRGR